MTLRYAQIDDNGVCYAISYLSGEKDEPYLILLDDNDVVNLGDTYADGVWTPAPPQPPPTPQPSLEEQMAALQATNEELNGQIVSLFETLIEKGII